VTASCRPTAIVVLAAVLGVVATGAGVEPGSQEIQVPHGGSGAEHSRPAVPGPRRDPGFCIQRIAYALDPATGECRQFPTPCDIPEGWTEVESCPVGRPRPAPSVRPPEEAYAEARILHQAGRDREAAELYAKALTRSRALGRDERWVARVANDLGLVYLRQGRYGDAAALFHEVLDVQLRRKHWPGVAGALNNLGEVARHRNELDEAMEHYDRALALFERSGDEAGAADVLANMGLVHRQQERYDEALELAERALAIRRRIGPPHRVAELVVNVANIHQSRGDHPRARGLYEAALTEMRRAGNRPGIAVILGNLAGLHRAEGRHEEAMRLLCEGRAISRREGLAPWVATFDRNIGLLQHERPGLTCQGVAGRVRYEDPRGLFTARVPGAWRVLEREDGARRPPGYGAWILSRRLCSWA
jgi:tetratricopeptide (TPR) repeat protein